MNRPAPMPNHTGGQQDSRAPAQRGDMENSAPLVQKIHATLPVIRHEYRRMSYRTSVPAHRRRIDDAGDGSRIRRSRQIAASSALVERNGTQTRARS
jgi:hypothetical protein